MGNLAGGPGAGWSVEDEFAWTIGAESELTLPLPGHDRACVLRFNVQAAVFPPKVPRQRLMIRAGKAVLGSFDLTGRETIMVALPLDLTRGARQLALTFIHPDAVRPRDHQPVDDSRRLAICFHSGTLAGAESDDTVPSAAPYLDMVHGVIAGDITAMRIAEVIGKLPSLRGRFGIRFLDLSLPPNEALERLPPKTLRSMDCCWMELNAGSPSTRDPLRDRLPGGCELRTFYTPVAKSLWPFQAPDRRAVVEPGRYYPSRYPHGDRIVQALVSMNLPDDVLYLMYEMATGQDELDLGKMFDDDLRRWNAEGRQSDMNFAGFIVKHFTRDRIFSAPNRVGPLLLRQMVEQVLDNGTVRDIVRPETLAAELDTLLDGYVGWPEEVPIHKRVANHFNLSWWSPGMRYRWQNNLRTHREHVLDTINWAQWRP